MEKQPASAQPSSSCIEPHLLLLDSNKNSIILNDVYLGDNTYIENCIVESRDTIRANTRHVGESGVKVVVEKNERYAL